VSRNGTGAVVGEFRGTKRTTPAMKRWLQRGPADATPGSFRPHLRDAPDGKIALHFAHFKVLEDERETCFERPPHACPGWEAAAGGGGSGGGGKVSQGGAPEAGAAAGGSSAGGGGGGGGRAGEL
jgi:hypothetical protein